MFNIDAAIVILYLAFTLYVGIKYGSGTKTIEMFAIGGRNFNTPTLAATIAATYIAGGALVMQVQYAYQDGLLRFLTSIGIVICLFFIGSVFVPRMKEFFGKLSVADIMGSLYGNNVRIITAVTGFISSVGMVAVQIKILSFAVIYFSNIESNLAIYFSALVLIIYSVFGGVRAVTFTDVTQFITFFIIIPSIGISIFNIINVDTDSIVLEKAILHACALSNNSNTDYVALFFYVLIPTLEPTLVQRILMGKTTSQVTKAFQISSMIYFFYTLVASLIGIMIYAHNSDLEANMAFSYMVDQFTSPGIKGLVFISVIAMAMSTADSHLNASSVLFSHDFCKPLNIVRSEESILSSSRIFTLIIGALATILAMNFHNLISMLLFVNNFYKPIVSVPLILAILGFRSSTKSVLIGMAAGFSTVVIWKSYQFFSPGILNFDSLIPATCANLIFFVGSHYLLKQNGGWVGPKDTTPLKYIRANRLRYSHIFKSKIYEIWRAFVTPMSSTLKVRTSDFMYVFLGIIILLSYITIESATNSVVKEKFSVLLQIITLFIAALMMTKMLWEKALPKDLSSFAILISVSYMIFFTSLMMFTHGFANVAIICLVVNVLISSLFFDLLSAILISIFSFGIAMFYYIIAYGDFIFSNEYDGYSVTLYITFVLSITFLLFFRKQQNQLSILEDRETNLKKLNEILNSKIETRERNLKKALDMHSDILRNINHEIKTPMSSLMSNADLLKDTWKDPKLHTYMDNLIDGVSSSVVRFSDYASNLIDLSQYQTHKMLFDIKQNNLRSILEGFLGKAENIFLNYPKERESELEFDEIKIRAMFNNIIDNANKYSEGSDIEILVTSAPDIIFDGKNWHAIKIIVKDSGIGIPAEELEKIFEPFTLGSRTSDGSGGRGLGLAIAREVITAHQGYISAYNNVDKGVSMEIILPVKHPRAKFLSDARNANNSNRDMDLEKIDLGKIIADTKKIDEKYQGKTPKILMIDDDPAILSAGGMIIKSLGYEFMGISTGDEAVEYINGDKFDSSLILLDMMLGDTDGLEVMKDVKARIDETKVPVIIQSGLSPKEKSVIATLELGAKEFMAKPYKRADIDFVIRKYLGLE